MSHQAVTVNKAQRLSLPSNSNNMLMAVAFDEIHVDPGS